MDTFEKNVQIPKHEWEYNFQPEINFTITDTVSAYNVFVTLRHTDAYAYKNIWLFISTQQPGNNNIQKERFEFVLQSPVTCNDGAFLFHNTAVPEWWNR